MQHACNLLDDWLRNGLEGPGETLNDPAKQQEELIREVLLHISTAKNNEETKLLVHNYQVLAARQLDKLYPFPENNTYNGKHYSQVMAEALIALIHFLRREYPQYFNPQQQVPLCMIQIIQGSLEDHFNDLRENMVKHCSDPELRSLVLFPFKKFLSLTVTGNCNFYRICFIKSAMCQLPAVLRKNKAIPADKQLIKRLVELNFNHPAFIKYFIKNYRLQADAFEDNHLQLEKWHELLYETECMQLTPGMSWDNQLLPIKDQVADAIAREINLLTNKLKLFPKIDPSDHFEKSRVQKLPLNISVPQVALLLRLLVDTGMIGCNNQHELLVKAANLFSTPRASSISLVSLRVNYYSIERPALVVVKELLLNMVHAMNGLENKPAS